MSDIFSLQGRVALITGASRGLGFEMAKALARAGAHVVINGSNAERAEAAAQAIGTEGGSASAACFDVGDHQTGEKQLRAIVAKQGRLDVLINNVGLRLRQPLQDISTEAFKRLLDVDLVAPFALSRAAAEHMRAGGYGRIINISSTQALQGRKGDAAYITAKGGLISLSRALAAEFGADGITCNAILPGSFETETNLPFTQTEQARSLVSKRTFLKRFGRPHEIGGAAVFLASEAGSYVSGAALLVDGGWTAAF